MAYTLNRRLAELIDSNGQLQSGKISNGYISTDHFANNSITQGKLHSTFVLPSSALSGVNADNVSEGSTNLYFTNARADARADARIAAANTGDLSEGSNLYYTDARVGTYISGNRTFGNITTTGYIAGPATFTIDPAAVGDNTGTVVIAGNLQVDGTTTTINSTTLTVDDKLVTLASGSANAGAANGAGIEVDISGATNPSLTYDGTTDEWDFNKNVNVAGSLDLSANTSFPTAGFTLHTNGFLYTKLGSNGFIFSAQNGTEAMRINSGGTQLNIPNGSLMVGSTTAPSGLVHVASSNGSGGDLWTQVGAGNTSAIHIQNTANAANTNAVLYFRNSVGEKASVGARFVNQSTGETELRFSTTNSSGTSRERVTIGGDGNVGIGTTPATWAKLDILGSGGAQTGATQALQVKAPSATAGEGVGIRLNAASGSHEAVGIIGMVNNASGNAGSMTFHTYNLGATIEEQMRIDNLGNVGIGTDSPGERLEVDGVIQIKRTSDHPAMRFSEVVSGTATTRAYFGSGDWAINGGDPDDFGISGSGTGDLLLGTTAGVERLRITNNGTVGIGATSGEANLVVRDKTNGTHKGGRIGFGIHEAGALQIYDAVTMSRTAGSTVTDSTASGGQNVTLSSGQLYGPYHTLPRGSYRLCVKMKTTNASYTGDAARLTCHVSSGTVIPESRIIKGVDFGTNNKWQSFSVPFQVVGAATNAVEFYLFALNNQAISVDYFFIMNDTDSYSTRVYGNQIVDGDVLVGTSTNLDVLSGTPKLQIGSGTGHASLQFYSGTANVNGIYFGDATAGNDRYSGYIEYRHSDDSMAFRVNGDTALTIDSHGLMQGSLSRYTNTAVSHIIMEATNEIGVTIGSSWTTLSTWVASQSGELRTTFGAYISSGAYYFNYRFFNATKNAVVKMSDNSTDASYYFNVNQTSNEGNVHTWQYYLLDLGVIDAGDEIQIQMQAATGSGTGAAGTGQIGYLKQWKFLSGKQVPVERDHGVMNRPTVRGVMRQSQQQNGNGPITHTIPVFLGSGTHNIFSILTGFDQGSMAVASIRYVGLYAYAGSNSALGDQQATIRRANSNTAWQTGAKTVHFETNGGSISTPAFAWTTGGVLQMIIAGSVQIVGEVSITTHSIPGYKYGINI